jgi:cysteinyl-tRNA synthetase
VLGIVALARTRATVDTDLARWVEDRLAARKAARDRRDFTAADRIRDELTEAGVQVEDTPHGVRWKLR